MHPLDSGLEGGDAFVQRFTPDSGIVPGTGQVPSVCQ